MSLYDKYVGPEGTASSKIMIIGEAPGSDEHEEGRPFVGRSGQFLERYLGRCGVRRHDVWLTNLCKYRPKGNKFEQVLGTTRQAEGLEELQQEIEAVNPNVILTVGAWPMYYLTGTKSTKKGAKNGTGILTWRGSMLPSIDRYIGIEGKKVFITLHPAFVVRPQGFFWNPVFLTDIQNAVNERHDPALNYPEYEEFIDPPGDVLESLIQEMSEAEWLTVDIETFGNDLACVGFTDSTARGLCITFMNGDWEPARRLLLSDAKKNFQFGAFDINFLSHFYGWEAKNYAFDTYIAANTLMPRYPNGLDFLASIYTRFPYYKEERKSWKENTDLDMLWSYNIKDVVAQHDIALQQMDELKGRF